MIGTKLEFQKEEKWERLNLKICEKRYRRFLIFCLFATLLKYFDIKILKVYNCLTSLLFYC